MLVVNVPLDLKNTVSHEWFGLSLRQLGCAAVMALIAIGSIALNFIYPQVGKDLTNFIIFPIAILGGIGWWRPMNLNPEDYLKLIIREKRVIGNKPLLCEGEIPIHHKAERHSKIREN